MAQNKELVQGMRTRMEAVAAIVNEVPNISAVYDYVLEVCEKKAPYISLTNENRPADAPKIIAAPAFANNEYNELEKLAAKKNMQLINNDLRNHVGGLDVVVTVGEYGIAATGTCVLESSSEAIRLATMLAEVHIMVIKKSTIVAKSQDIADVLTKWQQESRYIAFISGASRTADIERVLAIGVHGPLEFHLLLLEG